MDEYIKVKDLIDMLEQRLVFQETHGFYRDAGYTSRFIESIADIPHINVAPKPEWISVDERLPDKHGKYLVYRKCHCVSYVYIVYYDTNRSVWYFFDSEWGDCEVNDITHWMPLPEPPKEENTNL